MTQKESPGGLGSQGQGRKKELNYPNKKAAERQEDLLNAALAYVEIKQLINLSADGKKLLELEKAPLGKRLEIAAQIPLKTRKAIFQPDGFYREGAK